jgi:hypothetical protein
MPKRKDLQLVCQPWVTKWLLFVSWSNSSSYPFFSKMDTLFKSHNRGNMFNLDPWPNPPQEFDQKYSHTLLVGWVHISLTWWVGDPLLELPSIQHVAWPFSELNSQPSMKQPWIPMFTQCFGMTPILPCR